MSTTPSPVAMLSPDYSKTKMIPPDQVDTAHDAGWSEASKMIAPEGQHKWVPNEHMDMLQQKGWTKIEADGSFNIQPTEGESFEDTMQRAAKAGQWLSNHPAVSQPLIQNQAKKGLQAAPLALAAGPVMAGAQMGASVAPSLAIQGGIQGAKAVTAWAAAHPFAAKVTYEVLKAALTAGATALGGTAALKMAGKVIGSAPNTQ